MASLLLEPAKPDRERLLSTHCRPVVRYDRVYCPAVGAFGTLGHNALRGPGRDNWNMSLFKSFLFSEARGSRLEFRAESFNTWNHTEFNAVSTNLGDSKFGQVTSAFEPRIFQLGMKIVF